LAKRHIAPHSSTMLRRMPYQIQAVCAMCCWQTSGTKEEVGSTAIS